MSAKPILLVRVNAKHAQPPKGTIPKWEAVRAVQDGLSKRLANEYHLLVVPNYNPDSQLIEIEAFFEKDLTPIQFNELKALVEAEVKKETL